MNTGLYTDLYQLTMGYGYWKQAWYGKDSVFHLFFRKYPFKGNYAIACGLDLAIDYINNLSFSVEDIQYLGSLKGADGKPLFDESYLNYLQRMEFSCDIDAVPEGTAVHPHQPLLRVRGPLLQAQLIETALLNLINFSTLIATKAARIALAAKGEPVLEFGFRRAQGFDGAISASRAAYIGGAAATSNVIAGRKFDIPVKGTHAHSWVMCFPNEAIAFEEYAAAMPNNCVFLVDTYDTIEGVKEAIKIGSKLRAKGHEMLGVRLDSGDLADLSKKARQLLDEAGFEKANIVASNDLDEYRIKELKEQGASINVWGVGTRLSTAYDQPALGGVYKLAAIKNEEDEWDYKVKLSENTIKVSNPGILQTRRLYQNKKAVADIMYHELGDKPDTTLEAFDGKKYNLSSDGCEDLLVPIFRQGKQVYQSPSIHEMRALGLEQAASFSVQQVYPNGLEPSLYQKKMKIIEGIRNDNKPDSKV